MIKVKYLVVVIIIVIVIIILLFYDHPIAFDMANFSKGRACVLSPSYYFDTWDIVAAYSLL